MTLKIKNCYNILMHKGQKHLGPIPVLRGGVINELSSKGANVIFQDAHVSGHACQEELKLIYSLVKPKYAIPVHGEYRHLKANAGIAKNLGIPKENIFLSLIHI